MNTLYVKKLKSGNYEITNRDNFTEKFTTKKSLLEFWTRIQREKSNVWNRRSYSFKPARIVKARYSQSQTYFNSFDELYKIAKLKA